ncbi:hypothetical protein L249_7034, partial [Ophiocordyceps polyrhachis-furcata BCC 54312]
MYPCIHVPVPYFFVFLNFSFFMVSGSSFPGFLGCIYLGTFFLFPLPSRSYRTEAEYLGRRLAVDHSYAAKGTQGTYSHVRTKRRTIPAGRERLGCKNGPPIPSPALLVHLRRGIFFFFFF